MIRFFKRNVKLNNTTLCICRIKRFISYGDKKIEIKDNGLEKEIYEEYIEFDNRTATTLTFDINVDDEWKRKEEKEYEKYLQRTEEEEQKEEEEEVEKYENSLNGKKEKQEYENGLYRTKEEEKETSSENEGSYEIASDYSNSNSDIEKNAKILKISKYINELNVQKKLDEDIFMSVLHELQEDNNLIYALEDEIGNTLIHFIHEYFDRMSYDLLIKVLDFLEVLNMKNVIRDLHRGMLKVLKKENDDIFTEERKIKLCLHFIKLLNNNSLYFSELYEFLTKQLNKMKEEDLPVFANECFKHSLRCKHFLDQVVVICTEKRNQFSLPQLQSLYHSFHLFCKEYSSFYNSSLIIIEKNIAHFDLHFYKLLLKIANNFKNNERYNNLVGVISCQLDKKVEELQLSANRASLIKRSKVEESTNVHEETTENGKGRHIMEKTEKTEKTHSEDIKRCEVKEQEEMLCLIQCLRYLEHDKRRNGEAKKVINSIYELLNKKTDFIKSLNVEDLVYTIVCFCSYNKRITLYNTFLDVLCEKSTELIHAKNISLWILPLLSLSKIAWFHFNYLSHVVNFINDSYILNRLSVFQLLKLLSSLVKVNVYDEKTYKILIEKLYKEWDIIEKKFIDISTFLWSCAYVNIIYKPLFDDSYNMIINLLNNNSYDWHNVTYKNCFVNITWSFIIANYHKKEKDFYKILDVTFLNRDPDDTQAFKRLHQIADSCFKEIPNSLVHIKALDIMYKYCMHEKCKTVRNEFSIYKKEKDAMKVKKKILDELIQILQKFQVPFSLNVEPYHNSPYIIDVVLNEVLKIGICIFGKEHIMRTLDTPSWSYMNTGFVALQLRILHEHGWKIIPINAGEWMQLNSDQKTSMLKDLFQHNCIQL